MRTLVTGATGFIGQNLCRALSKKHVDFHVLGRKSPMFDAKFYTWNMQEVPDIGCLYGIDTIFHLAGKTYPLAETRQDEAEYFHINTEGTHKLLEAARAAKVKRFVYFSSVKAMGEANNKYQDELAACHPETPYGQSKREAEQLILEGGYVAEPVVLRLSMVYGITPTGNLPRMIKAVHRGRFPSLPETGNKRSMVHVGDVVKAAILAAEKVEAASQTYIITDGIPYSTHQIYEWVCHALGKPVPSWHVPIGMLKLLARAGDGIGILRGRRFMFDSDALEKLFGSAWYSSEKIQRELGYKPAHDLRSTLPEMIEHLYHEHDA